MGFLVSDREKNLVLYMYQPEARESLGGKHCWMNIDTTSLIINCKIINIFPTGQKLLRKADFHLGQNVNTFFRLAVKISERDEDSKIFTGGDRRHMTMFGK